MQFNPSLKAWVIVIDSPILEAWRNIDLIPDSSMIGIRIFIPGNIGFDTRQEAENWLINNRNSHIRYWNYKVFDNRHPRCPFRLREVLGVRYQFDEPF